jgi:hypothetical protein
MFPVFTKIRYKKKTGAYLSEISLPTLRYYAHLLQIPLTTTSVLVEENPLGNTTWGANT